MSYRFATYEKRGRIAYVTVNRPEVMNALHLEAHLELAEIWEDFRDDAEVWVAILTGPAIARSRPATTSRPPPSGRPTAPMSRATRGRRSGASRAISTARSP